MAELTGKVAWITGAGTGIGEAAALALAREGATVVLTGRRAEPLNSVAERVKAAGGKALVVPGDVSRPETAGIRWHTAMLRRLWSSSARRPPH